MPSPPSLIGGFKHPAATASDLFGDMLCFDAAVMSIAMTGQRLSPMIRESSGKLSGRS